MLLLVLAIPALDYLLRAARQRPLARLAVAALAVGVAVQFGHFAHVYTDRGPARTERFEAGVPRLLDRADGGVPPSGSTVFGRFHGCDYVSSALDRSHTYWIAQAVGPATS